MPMVLNSKSGRTPLAKRTNSNDVPLPSSAKTPKRVTFSRESPRKSTLRRSIRSTISKTASVSTPTSTPKSLLRNEMTHVKDQDNDDDSLLYSPPKKQLIKALPTKAKTKQQSLGPPLRPKAIKETPRSPPSKTPLTTLSTTNTSKNPPLAQILPNAMPNGTPFTPRGVCMDLSGMFMDVQSHKKNPIKHHPPRPYKKVEHTQPDKQKPQWAQQQCDTFTNWLNYTLQPEESQNNETQGAHHALLLHQQMAQVRIKALHLFNSKEMDNIRNLVQQEIKRDKIKLRTERDICADLTQRNLLMDLLFSVSLPWLRLALETVFGQSIVPEEPQQLASPVIKTKHQRESESRLHLKAAVKTFIVNNVLSDKTVLEKYTKGKCKVPSGEFEVRYRAEMQTLVLYRLLVLFFFLDRAKQQNILEKVTRLFGRNSPVKSSRELLLSFSRDFLSAEGDFVKHLSRIGLRVSYRQDICDELDYAVTNLAIDLRDGVRLARLLELVTGAAHKSILQKLRLPAVSRLQKLHNVGFVLDRFRELGVKIDIIPHHIVDGHREMVLKLMWLILSHCCLTKLVNEDAIEQEILRITGTTNYRLKENVPDDHTPVAVIKSKLLRWCQAVGSKFAVRVDNLSESLKDGHVLALMIHYYHPELIRWRELQMRENESLVILANRRMRELGGIPDMIPSTDEASGVDERATILCLSYMFSRLIDSSVEVRAAMVIQQKYRAYRQAEFREVQSKMASKILAAWRKHRRQYFQNQRTKYAVAVIEDFVYLYQPRLQAISRRRKRNEQYSKAAILIQSITRRNLQLSRYRARIYSAEAVVCIQSVVRRFLARRSLARILLLDEAARKIQRCWRLFCTHEIMSDRAACVIQKVWRGFLTQMLFHLDLIDIITVQARARGYIARRSLEKSRRSIECLQRRARAYLAVKRLRSTRASVTKVQSQFRATKERRRFIQMRESAIRVQAVLRGAIQAKRFRIIKNSAILLQSKARRLISGSDYRRRKAAIQTIHGFLRGVLLRKFLSRITSLANRRRDNAALLIQRSWRLFDTRKRFDEHIRSGAVTHIQSFVRMRKARADFVKAKTSTIMIQSVLRRHSAQKVYQKKATAVLMLQALARQYIATTLFQLKLRSAIQIQAAIRMLLVKHEKDWIVRNTAVTRLQGFVRLFLAKKELLIRRERKSATVIISSIRTFVARKRYLQIIQRRRKEGAACCLQRAWRSFVLRQLSEERWLELQQQSAATAIQKTWRCYTVHVDYLLTILATIQIQSEIRRFLSRRTLERRQYSALVIGDFVKRFLERRKTARRHQAAIVIQAVVRSLFVQRSHSTKVLAATTIQRVFRGYLVRLDTEIAHFAATEIQKMWRGLSVWADFVFKLFTIVKIQSCARMMIARREIKAHRQEMLRQMQTRAAVRIQKAIRQHQSKGAFGRFRSTVVSLQSYIRGYLIRTKRVDAIERVAKRLEVASKQASLHPELRLGNKTIAALTILQKSRSLSEIMSILRTLELATRLSYDCCKAFVKAEAPKLLFAFATTCNRSVPHTEVIQCTLMTMLNVTQHSRFLSAIANETSLEICLDLVQMFRDKDGVFVPAVVLLEQIARFSDNLQGHCGRPEHLKRLKGVYTLCRRKLALPTTRTSISGRPSVASVGRSSLANQWKRRVILQREMPDLRQGVRTLQRIIRLVDNENS